MNLIENHTFGKITIDGKDYQDIKMIKDKVIPWNYIEHHTVTKQDIIELFKENPEYVVVGTGYEGLVNVKDDVIELAKEKNIKLIIENTERACEFYNQLKQEGKIVNAIIHSTC